MASKEYIGLVPAAGKGVRLGLPYPKELYPIITNNRYRPVALFVVDAMKEAGVHDIVYVINETKHQLIAYFGSGARFGCNFSYVYQEATSSGTSSSPGLADALNSAYHLICGKNVLFGMPDSIMEPTSVFRLALEQFHAETECLLCLFPTTHPEKFGMVATSQNGEVIQIVDKPKTTTLKFMWGCIIWRPTFTEFLHHEIVVNNQKDFAMVLNNAISNGLKIRSIKFNQGSFEDLGTYEQIVERDS